MNLDLILKYSIDIFLWLLLVLLNYSSIHSSFPRFKDTYWFSVILIIMFAVFGYITGDYDNYIYIYDASEYYNETVHVESLYAALMDWSHGNYALWRFFIWGPAVLIYGIILKKLNVNLNVAFMFFAILPMFYFCSHRQYLGLAIMYLGLVFFTTPSKNLIMSRLFAVMLMISSIYFHRSMPLYILLALVAMLPFKKSTYIIMALLFPVIYINFEWILNFVTVTVNTSAMELYSRNYIDSEFRVDITMWGIIGNIVNQLPVYLLLVYALYKSAFSSDAFAVPLMAKIFLNLAVLEIYLSLLFTGQEVSAFLAPRFREYSLMPLSMFYTIYLTRCRMNRVIRTFVYMVLFADLYMLAYSIYKL